jgi:hypothetical protein
MWHKRKYNAFDTTTDWSTPPAPCDPHTCLDPPLPTPVSEARGKATSPPPSNGMASTTSYSQP